MKLRETSFDSETLQFLYAAVVLILIPLAITVNTLYFLHSMQRDSDYELNNKALLVESALAMSIGDTINDPKLQTRIHTFITQLPEVKAIEIFRVNQDEDIATLATTSQLTKNVQDEVLNHLAWGSNQAYSKQIVSSLGNAGKERMWLVAGPIHDTSGKKVGLINLYLSAAQVDEITNRTVTDSLIILTVTMIGIMLLLLNHFRLFEISVLFKRLKDVDRAKDDFISIASHELRSPITALEGYISLLKDSAYVKAHSETEKQVTSLMVHIKRLGVLVEDLLNVSRIDQNRIILNTAPCDIGETMTRILSEFSLQAKEKALDIQYTLIDKTYVVSADQKKLEEVFSNIISNAVKYTPSGTIQVFHEVTDTAIKTYVKDTGVGISQENKGKLFKKFSRIYRDQTKDVTGTGLGLWITKQLVERMGGNISIESIENQGTEVIVAFPFTK